MGCGASKQMAQGQTTTRSVAAVAPADDKGTSNKGQQVVSSGPVQQPPAAATTQKTRSPTTEQGNGSQLQVDGTLRMSHQGSYQESSSRATAASTTAIRGASQTDIKVRDSNTAIKSSHAGISPGISHSPTTEADRPSAHAASIKQDEQSEPSVQPDILPAVVPHKEVSRSAYLAMQSNMVEDTSSARSSSQLLPKSKAAGGGSTPALKAQSSTVLAMNTALPASRNDLASTASVHQQPSNNSKKTKSQSINNLTSTAAGGGQSHTALAMNTALPSSRNDLVKSQASVAGNTSPSDVPKKSQSVQHLSSRAQLSGDANGNPSAVMSTTALALTTALPLSNANLLSQESVSPQHEVADRKGHTALPGGSNSNVTKIMSGSQQSLTDGLIGHETTLPEHEVADAKGHTALPGGSNTALAKVRSGSLHSLKDGEASHAPVDVANSEGPTQMAQKSYSRSGSRASLPPALETVTEVASPTSAHSEQVNKATSEPNIAGGFILSVEETPQEKVVEPVMSDVVAWEIARTRPLPASTNELSKPAEPESRKSQDRTSATVKAKKAVSVTELASPAGRSNTGVKKAEPKGDALDLAARKPLPPSTNELADSTSHSIKKAESKADALEFASRKPLPPSTYDLANGNGSGTSKGSKADVSSGHRRPPSGGMAGSPMSSKKDGGSRPSSTGSHKKSGSNARVSNLGQNPGSRKGSAGSARQSSRPASGAHA